MTGVVENNLIYYIYYFKYYFQTCRRLNWLPQDRYWVLIMKQVSLIHFPFVYIIKLKKKRRNYLGLVGLIKIIVFWKILERTTYLPEKDLYKDKESCCGEEIFSLKFGYLG